VFSIEVELKLLPLIVTVLPIPPNAGSIKSMMGCAIINDDKNNIVITRFLYLFIMLIQRLIISYYLYLNIDKSAHSKSKHPPTNKNTAYGRDMI
jgi:hypothetical protein